MFFLRRIMLVELILIFHKVKPMIIEDYNPFFPLKDLTEVFWGSSDVAKAFDTTFEETCKIVANQDDYFAIKSWLKGDEFKDEIEFLNSQFWKKVNESYFRQQREILNRFGFPLGFDSYQKHLFELKKNEEDRWSNYFSDLVRVLDYSLDKLNKRVDMLIFLLDNSDELDSKDFFKDANLLKKVVDKELLLKPFKDFKKLLVDFKNFILCRN
jgi:hypothetical protein